MDNVYVCTVLSTQDLTNVGKVSVSNKLLFPEGSGDALMAPSFQGLFGCPEEGSKVLVVKALEDGDDFYNHFIIGAVPTVLTRPVLEEEKNISEDKIPSDLPQTTLPYGKMYTEDMGVHVKTVLQSRKNHRLELSEKVERGLNVEDLIQENYALLRTSEGKFIKLDDGTGEGFDRVEIGDGQGNQIIIQTGEDEVSGPMAITIKCEGNINIESKSGNISVACDSVDSELNLETQGRLSLMSPDIFIGGNTTV